MFAQEIPQELQGKYHALRWEELSGQRNSRSLIVTNPPENPRSIAEFEPNQGVIVAYPQSRGFGIPNSLIAELSEDDTVYLICNASDQNSVRNELQNSGVNMNHLRFVSTDIDSYWARDYSPWFIEYGDKQVGMIDYVYNRPRPNDDEVTNFFGTYFGKQVFGMQVEHTGGNYMTDGLGVAASCSASLDVENANKYGYTQAQLDTIFKHYLGLTNYMHLDDPLADYIAHIDCWGKFIDVDKIVITKVPSSNSHYADYEAMADYWANQTSSYGNKYKVYRTYSPDGEPYSNSLILNKKVYLAFPDNDATNNANAKAVYEEAMPGYEVIGFLPRNNLQDSWKSTDALHCRTHEVPRFDMLRIAHYPILDTVEYAETYTIAADIYTLGNGGAITSAEVFFKIDDGEYISEPMTNVSGDEYTFTFEGLQRGQTISYYIKAENEQGQMQTHPFIGEPDPHVFVIKNGDDPSLSIDASIDNGYIKCFPNPATEVLYFISNNVDEGSYRVEIINQQGAVVKSLATDASSKWEGACIDISDMAAGLYFVRMYNSNKAYTCKFSKL
jgi:agmatine/peptidylarginine deiminase